MTITTIETAVRRIASNALSFTHDCVNDATAITDKFHMAAINDETCIAMNIKISHAETLTIKTVGDYIALVHSKR